MDIMKDLLFSFLVDGGMGMYVIVVKLGWC